MEKVSVLLTWSGLSGRNNINVGTIKNAAEKWAIEIGADFNVYTDGSASGDLLDDVVIKGNPTPPEALKIIRWKGARFTCFYEK